MSVIDKAIFDMQAAGQLPDRYGVGQDKPQCPFCNARYASDNEIRAEVKCVACNGMGRSAAILVAWMDTEIDIATEKQDLSRLDFLAEHVWHNYFNFEINRRIRALKKLKDEES